MSCGLVHSYPPNRCLHIPEKGQRYPVEESRDYCTMNINAAGLSKKASIYIPKHTASYPEDSAINIHRQEIFISEEISLSYISYHEIGQS